MLQPGPPGRLPAGGVAVLSIPFDGNSSFLKGPAEAPARILEAVGTPSSNLCCEGGLDLAEDGRWGVVAPVVPADDDSHAAIQSAVADLLAADLRVLSLGGDHSITHPIMRAYAGAGVPAGLTIVQMDAHPDLYDQLDGNRQSHACPFARIMEEGLAQRLIQVGIRTATPHQRRQAERFGVEMREARYGAGPGFRPGPCYVSLDLDVLDPAFAPGVSHIEPGGLSVRQVLDVLQAIPGPIVGADIVELNPRRDPTGVTAMVGAKFLKELVGLMMEGR